MTEEIQKYDGPFIKDVISNPDAAKIMAREIVDLIVNKGDLTTLQCSFDASKSGQLAPDADKKPNTTFQCDIPKEYNLNAFKKALYNEEMTEEKNIIVQQFIFVLVFNILAHASEIRNKLRKVLLKEENELFFPMNKIKILNLEIINGDFYPHYSKFNMLFQQKYECQQSGTTVDHDKIKQAFDFETDVPGNENLNCEELFEILKDKNPAFDCLAAIKLGNQFLFELTINFFVDYSLDTHRNPLNLEIDAMSTKVNQKLTFDIIDFAGKHFIPQKLVVAEQDENPTNVVYADYYLECEEEDSLKLILRCAAKQGDIPPCIQIIREIDEEEYNSELYDILNNPEEYNMVISDGDQSKVFDRKAPGQAAPNKLKLKSFRNTKKAGENNGNIEIWEYRREIDTEDGEDSKTKDVELLTYEVTYEDGKEHKIRILQGVKIAPSEVKVEDLKNELPG